MSEGVPRRRAGVDGTQYGLGVGWELRVELSHFPPLAEQGRCAPPFFNVPHIMCQNNTIANMSTNEPPNNNLKSTDMEEQEKRRSDRLRMSHGSGQNLISPEVAADAPGKSGPVPPAAQDTTAAAGSGEETVSPNVLPVQADTAEVEQPEGGGATDPNLSTPARPGRRTKDDGQITTPSSTRRDAKLMKIGQTPPSQRLLKEAEARADEEMATKLPGVEPADGGIPEEDEEDPVSDISDDEDEGEGEANPRPLVDPKECLMAISKKQAEVASLKEALRLLDQPDPMSTEVPQEELDVMLQECSVAEQKFKTAAEECMFLEHQWNVGNGHSHHFKDKDDKVLICSVSHDSCLGVTKVTGTFPKKIKFCNDSSCSTPSHSKLKAPLLVTNALLVHLPRDKAALPLLLPAPESLGDVEVVSQAIGTKQFAVKEMLEAMASEPSQP